MTESPRITNDKRDWYRSIYLKSEHWKDLRLRKLSESPICECCKTSRAVEPHHLNYKNIFDVELNDLLSVCRLCHKRLHSEADDMKRRQKKNAIRRARKVIGKSIAPSMTRKVGLKREEPPGPYPCGVIGSNRLGKRLNHLRSCSNSACRALFAKWHHIMDHAAAVHLS